MGRKNKLDSSFNIIEDYFDKSDLKSFTEYKFGEIFIRNRHSWGVPVDRNASQVLTYLVNRKVMIENTFINDSNESKAIYSWKSKDEFPRQFLFICSIVLTHEEFGKYCNTI